MEAKGFWLGCVWAGSVEWAGDFFAAGFQSGPLQKHCIY